MHLMKLRFIFAIFGASEHTHLDIVKVFAVVVSSDMHVGRWVGT